MVKRKKIIYTLIVSFLLIGVYFGMPLVVSKYSFIKFANAVGGYPYQIGLVGVTVIPCVEVGLPPVCTGGLLCSVKDPAKDPATCMLYSEVTGTPAGGTGMNGLFLKTNLSLAGVVPGGQLIAGGVSNVLMDGGVLAGALGCTGSGCVVDSLESGFFAVDVLEELYKYYIVGGRE